MPVISNSELSRFEMACIPCKSNPKIRRRIVRKILSTLPFFPRFCPYTSVMIEYITNAIPILILAAVTSIPNKLNNLATPRFEAIMSVVSATYAPSFS